MTGKPAYYNEIDPYPAQWLRNLIAAGHLPAGDVDERDIREVSGDDFEAYGQCHFFAGIGGLALALRLAGVSDDASIVTGGPPCQDASVAASIQGRRTGLAGKRTGLALVMLALIAAQERDWVVFENVPGLESEMPEIEGRLALAGYRVSRRRAEAGRHGAPHPRRRLLVVAHRDGAGLAFPRPGRSSEAARDPWASVDRSLWKEDHAWNCLLDDGVPYSVVGLRAKRIGAFGNAVVPKAVAAEFIEAVMGARP